MKISDRVIRWDNAALFRLLVPLIIEQILALTMGTADMMMVSFVGEYAVSSVNIVNNISNLLIMAFIALSTGGAVVTSQYIGRQDGASAGNAAKQLLYLVAAVAGVMMLLALVLCRPLIRILYGDLAPDVMDAAALYLFITAFSYPFFALNHAGAALFRASGNSHTSMKVALLANIINVGGNAVFIFVLHLGVFGAALATLISRVIGAVIIMSLLIIKGNGPIRLTGIHRVKPAWRMIRQIARVGIPSGLESSMFNIGRLLTQRIFTPFGTSTIAANAIASTVDSFTVMPAMAFGMTLLTVVGQYVGAGNLEAAKKTTAKIIRIGYGVLFLINGAVYLFVDPIIRWFHLSPDAHSLARLFILVNCVTESLFFIPSFTLPNALRAAGDARHVLLVAAASMWIARVCGAYFFVYVLGFGPVGVWIAMGIDTACRGIFYIVRWQGGRWQTKKVIDD
jgi:putative MATE family efflux protein